MFPELKRHCCSGIKKSKILFVIFLFCLVINPFFAVLNAEVLTSIVPRASLVGKGTLTFALLDVYEAKLYAPSGKYHASNPYALSLQYFMNLKGRAIAERSITEMRRQGMKDEAMLKEWLDVMAKIFPDVNKGTVLTGYYIPGKETRFYNGSTLIGTVNGDDFGKAFFGIWLSKNTSEPRLRKALLGLP